ncbi:MAG: stage II sporulation protein D [Candidatus Improbicoccus pseudotrichonymphae]|uniref:Stage II sporulation protein D n=1 Tax=Candidatus Improbicoccus pseudotrichonymphae TaxID=3033792 RepID=A0AA48I2T8_9FIRM|nr:MAG: stage II sporulation protein D [Candidatus Improbicoccus pseudotrichonymphae]
MFFVKTNFNFFKKIISLVFVFFLMAVVPLISFLSIFILKKQLNYNYLSKNHKDKKEYCCEENEIIEEATIDKENICSIYDKKTNKIIKVDKSTFLQSILAAEMPANYEKEALKALVVAINSYYHYKLKELKNSNKGKNFTVNDGSTLYYMSEGEKRNRWGTNYEKYRDKFKNAVEEVNNEILLDKEKNPILAMFHATSSGTTNSAADVLGRNIPYLERIDSQGDMFAPNYIRTIEIDKKFFKNKLEKYLKIKLKENEIKQIKTSSAENKFVKYVQIGKNKIEGKKFQILFAIPSPNYEILQETNKIIIKIYGNGHGVGLSQNGANYLAKQKMNYEKILQYYYPNTTLVRNSGKR